MSAVERLDRGLLVDAEHGRVLRRVEVQPDHVSRLGLEVRVARRDSPRADAT
jgi:hypothetical protein